MNMCTDNDDDANTTTEILILRPFLSSKNTLLEPKTPCAICLTSDSGKYKCPKCSIRTCSVQCSKMHKDLQKCDGQRLPWQPIRGYSQFNDEVSIEDQQFMNRINKRLPKSDEDSKENKKDESSKLYKKVYLTTEDKYLMQNAQLRRVWLRLDSKYKSDGSRHERFSDTIFWTCTVKFICRAKKDNVALQCSPSIRQKAELNMTGPDGHGPIVPFAKYPIVDDYGSNSDDDHELHNEEEEQKMSDEKGCLDQNMDIEDDEGEIDINGIGVSMSESEPSNSSDDEGDELDEKPLDWTIYKVQNIPESIRVATLLRQFLRPKPHGSVISRSQLDMAKLEEFIRASEPLLSPTAFTGTSDSSYADKLTVYLEISTNNNNENEEDVENNEDEFRYYMVDTNQTILDNLRNRHVNGHPCFVVVLKRCSEFGEIELPMVSEKEQKQLQEKSRMGQFINDRPKWQQRNYSRGKSNRHPHWNRVRQGRGLNHHQPPHQFQWNGNPQQQLNPPTAVATSVNNANHYHFHPYQQRPPSQHFPRQPYSYGTGPQLDMQLQQQFRPYGLYNCRGTRGRWHHGRGGGHARSQGITK